MLAPVTGAERFITVGCGHGSQFCKAANVGCETPFKALQDLSGNIDAVALKKDRRLKSMLDDGWEWVIIQWQADEEWPELADIFQRALNASHQVASKSTELEAAVSMSDMAGATPTDKDWQDALATVASGNPPCFGYLKLLLELSRDYGGGHGAPALVKLDKLAKQHGENRRLGEEYISAVIGAKFLNTEVFPRIRDALLAANLTAPKVVDGIARMLGKTHIGMLTSKANFDMVKRAELELSRAVNIADAVVEKCSQEMSLAMEYQVNEVEGRFKIRVITHITNMGSKTFEAVTYEDLDIIIRKFMEEITALLLKNGVTDASYMKVCEPWLKIIGQSAETDSAAAKPTVQAPLTAEEVASKASVALKRGFAVGTNVVEGGQVQKSIFKITAIGDKVSMVEQNKFSDSPLTIHLPFQVFIKSWRKYEGDIATSVTGDWSARINMQSIDCMKATLLQAMASLHKDERLDHRDVILCLKPKGLRANKAFAKGELVFVPNVGFSSMSLSKNLASTGFDSGFSRKMNGESLTIKLMAPHQPQNENTEEWKDKDEVNPFWWIQPTSVDADANIVTKLVTHNGVKFNVFTNSVAVKKNDLLSILLRKSGLLSRWRALRWMSLRRNRAKQSECAYSHGFW